MPRIDPLQLLKCLSVLLSSDGGILSRDEVPRLVNLMTKFSKKLVSKCVYTLILKNTEKTLLNLFMAEGGWHLIYRWLDDAVSIGNYNLVCEILHLLLVTPVDVERLKVNSISKLVKSLSKREDLGEAHELSVRLVGEWLKIAKAMAREETLRMGQTMQEETASNNNNTVQTIEINEIKDNQSTVDGTQIIETNNKLSNDKTINPVTFYQITDHDGKQVISKIDEITTDSPIPEIVVLAEIDSKKDEKITKPSSSGNSKTKSKSSHSSSLSSKSRSSSSSSKSKSSSDRHRSSSSSSKSSKDNKGKDRKDRDKHKDRHKSSSSSSGKSSSSSSSKHKGETKEKQAEKDKDTLAKLKPQSIDKIGRIPKKSSTTNSDTEKAATTTTNTSEVKKKPTMSIEVRKSNSTVKVYQSKMRSTGLEEEVKPPGPRPLKKPTSSSTSSSVTLPTIPSPIPAATKRSSPTKDLLIPPEKKLKIDLPPPPTDRPGAIKLIPPKPKPPVLQESDIFMDALAASASAKKEPKRKKRRLSATKDTLESPTTPTQDSSITSPLGLKSIAAPNFYQDTLVESEKIDEKESNDNTETKSDENPGTPTNDISIDMNDIRSLSELKGILLDPKKKKAQKKTIKWRSDNDLVEVRYFDLDENERVNVSRNFMDMAKMEMSSEREALLLSRKLSNEDLMEPQMPWRPLHLIDYVEPLDVIPGRNSKEKGIQYAREITVLKALYFDKRKIPDSPEEPMPENHQMVDPIIMPLEDADSQEMDLRNTPWPEPKGSPPPTDHTLPQQLFQNLQMPFQNFAQLPPPNFQGMHQGPPRFGLPNNQPGGMFGGPPNMMTNGGPNMMGPPPDMLHHHQGPGLNNGMFVPGPDNFNPMAGGGGMNENFPLPFNPGNMNMFPPNNFNMNRGGGGRGGGGFRRGGGNNNGGNNSGGGWIRMNGSGNWNRGGGSGGPRGGRLCKNIKIHGFCRNMDNCSFIHPS